TDTDTDAKRLVFTHEVRILLHIFRSWRLCPRIKFVGSGSDPVEGESPSFCRCGVLVEEPILFAWNIRNQTDCRSRHRTVLRILNNALNRSAASADGDIQRRLG